VRGGLWPLRRLAILFSIALGSACATTGPGPETALSPDAFVEDQLISSLPWETNERSAQGGVFYDAYFNGVNGSSLATPVTTFRRYCEDRGGKLAAVGPSQVSAKSLATAEVPDEIDSRLSAAGRMFGTFGCEKRGEVSWLASVEPTHLQPSGLAPTWKLRMHVRTLPAAVATPAATSRVEAPEVDETIDEAPDVPLRTCEAAGSAECEQGRGYRSAPIEAGTAADSVGDVKRECLRGRAISCTNLGLRYRDGAGVAVNLRQATRFFKRGCSRGDGRGCTMLGWLQEQGEGGRRDATRAAKLYRQACKRGDARGCNNLAALHAQGFVGSRSARSGNPDSRARSVALRFFERSCGRGDAIGCTNLGQAQLGGKSSQRGALAARSFGRGCEGGDRVGCLRLGELYERGIGVTRDAGQARRLYRRACEPAGAGGSPPGDCAQLLPVGR
jgi:TPR repeat protein